jgi:hypothetical protein
MPFWLIEINLPEFHLRLPAGPLWVWARFFLHGMRLWDDLAGVIHHFQLLDHHRDELVRVRFLIHFRLTPV